MNQTKKDVRSFVFAAAVSTLLFFCGALTVFRAARADEAYGYRYDFMDKEQLSDFAATIDPHQNDEEKGFTGPDYITYIKDDPEALFDVNESLGTITSKREAMAGSDPSGNMVSLLYKNRQFTYFEIEARIKHTSTDNGWAGIVFGIEDRTRQPAYTENPNGGMFFMQGDGEPTYKHIVSGNDRFHQLAAVPGFNGLNYHTYRLTVYKNNIRFAVDGTEHFRLTPNDDQLSKGDIGIFVTNKAVTIDTIQFGALNDDGTPDNSFADSLAIESAPTTAVVGIPMNISVMQHPATLVNKGYVLSCDDTSACVVTGNKLIFKKSGTYRVKATAETNAAAFDTVDITVSEYPVTGYKPYAFTDDGMDKFQCVGISGEDRAVVNYTELFALNDGVLTRTPAADETEVSDHYAVLYVKDAELNEYKNFEVSFEAKSTVKNGWFGIFFNKRQKLDPGNKDGHSLFMQTEAKKTTSWGKGAAINELDVPVYWADEYSLYRFRVYGADTLRLEMYVVDMQTPVLTRTIAADSGYLGLFASTAEASFRNFYIAELDENGTIDTYVAPESVEITNKQAALEVGSSLVLEIKVLPENTSQRKCRYVSGSPAVATVNDRGVILALTAGTTTITAVCVDNPLARDTMELTVTLSPVGAAKVEIRNKPDTAGVGGTFELDVLVTPADADDKRVAFTSSDESVATVDDSGRVAFLKNGTVTVTAALKTDSSLSDSFTVNVKNNGGCRSGGIGKSMWLSAVLPIGVLLMSRKKRKQTV